MSAALPPVPGFVRTVLLLLGAARRRKAGRRRRARLLRRSRSDGQVSSLASVGGFIGLVMAIGLNAIAANVVLSAVTAGQRVDAERHGSEGGDWEVLNPNVPQSAPARFGTGNLELAPQTDPIFVEPQAAPGIAGLTPRGGLGGALGLFALAWWALVLVAQGETLDLDVQQRRHPAWEWVLSHPVPKGAMFCAEMLAPLAANPLFVSAPLLPGVLFGAVYGFGHGMPAIAAAGIPAAVALSCLSKLLEITLLLRLSSRTRGAAFGRLSWVGLMAQTLLVVGWPSVEPLARRLGAVLEPLDALPWPWLGRLLGEDAEGHFSFAAGVATWDAACAATIALSVWLSTRAATRGLVAPSAPPLRLRRHASVSARFRRHVIYRKELLWLARDRGALVQALLIPISVAAFQTINIGGLLSQASGKVNVLCGLAVLFGTYFLIVIGPRSLAAEGQSLWIAMTWPLGLERMLRAKAWLWTGIASLLVGLLLGYAAWRFPEGWLTVALTAIGWVPFARCLSLKTVTLAGVPDESGETAKTSSGRRWATLLGTLSFGAGVLSGQPSIAIVGILYSAVTAAAMWQDFRARLPYLFDPWSERLPQAPTLTHAMVAIAALLDLAVVTMGVLGAVAGAALRAAAWTAGHAIASAAVVLAVGYFLHRRGVRFGSLWRWETVRPGVRAAVSSVLLGALLGAALGVAAHGYMTWLSSRSWIQPLLDGSPDRLGTVPHMKAALFAMAVLVAPLAEEVLFRGLLYRALSREWAGWRAIVGSGGFFAIYHPALAWLPVSLLGMMNAVLFRRTGWLAASVASHMAYNAVVLAW